VSKSVWVIEAGSYSDYHVVGVFSTKENAERALGWLSAGGAEYLYRPSVGEWEMDPAIAELNAGMDQWSVCMDYDGTVERAKVEESRYDLNVDIRAWLRTKAPAYGGKGVNDAVEGTVWARDEEHAIKIANEKRLQRIASGELKSHEEVGS